MILKNLRKGQNFPPNLAILHHMGLGDHLCLNGLVRYTLSDLGFKHVVVFYQKKHRQSVIDMFSDDPRIEPVEAALVNNCPIAAANRHVSSLGKSYAYIKIGYEAYPEVAAANPLFPCDKCFYFMAEVPYTVRWSHFKFNRNETEQDRVYYKLNPKNQPYVFVHDDPSRGLKVNIKQPTGMILIRNDVTESIFNFAKILEEAQELHMMESSFRCFTEGLSVKANKLVFYDFRKTPGKIGTKYKWEMK